MEKKSRSKVNIGVKAGCDYAPAMLSSSRDMILTGRCDGPKKERSLREDQRTVPYVCFVLLDLVASCEDLSSRCAAKGEPVDLAVCVEAKQGEARGAWYTMMMMMMMATTKERGPKSDET